MLHGDCTPVDRSKPTERGALRTGGSFQKNKQPYHQMTKLHSTTLRPPKSRSKYAWHFLRGDTIEGYLYNSGKAPADGVWLTHPGVISLCYTGLHAAPKLSTAIAEFHYGRVLCYVECKDIGERENDKFVCRWRKIIWRTDFNSAFNETLRLFGLYLLKQKIIRRNESPKGKELRIAANQLLANKDIKELAHRSWVFINPYQEFSRFGRSERQLLSLVFAALSTAAIHRRIVTTNIPYDLKELIYGAPQKHKKYASALKRILNKQIRKFRIDTPLKEGKSKYLALH